jgi:prophage DNA circulation protein
MSTAAQVATSLQNFTAAVLAAITDPADALAIFSQLASFPQPTTASVASIGISQHTLQRAISDLCRRTAIGTLAQAVTLYQPSSYDDAQNIRSNICGIIDNEIQIAGDQGEDDTFLALKQLRSAVVQDLTSRGASLAPLVQIALGESLPALAISYRLYQDIKRTDQVISFADPQHPAFMPASFVALAR